MKVLLLDDQRTQVISRRRVFSAGTALVDHALAGLER